MANKILSVGIDIGTSTTQLVFSCVSVENTASYFSVPHVTIVDKEVVYRSDIYTTPLRSQSLIDADGVRDIVAGEFAKAGYTPQDTDTGAVIITGESARKENSALVLEKLSDFAGEFVVSTAGPDLEAIIAGKGSGAQQYSEDYSCTAVNLDIGGGTSNVVVFHSGRVIARGCLDIGGRLIRLQPDCTVTYISPAAAIIAGDCGVTIEVGKPATLADLRLICRRMSQMLEELLGLGDSSGLLPRIKTPGSSDFVCDRPIRAIFFSGGVADAVYKGLPGENPIPYGDIGVLLGVAIREGQLCSAYRLCRSRETIRATVVGAGSYTTSISGSTITYDSEVFPLKNIPVLKLGEMEQQAAFTGDAAPAIQSIRWFQQQSDSPQLVVALEGKPNPSYTELKAMAAALWQAVSETMPPEAPVLLVVEQDMAKALGQAVHSLAGGRQVVCLDSIVVEQNDYIDMGRPIMDGLVVPVVVKTLIFG